MPDIHGVGGEKGGAGKSTICKRILEDLLENQRRGRRKGAFMLGAQKRPSQGSSSSNNGG